MREQGGLVDYHSGESNEPAYEYPHTAPSPEIPNPIPPTRTKRFPFGAAGGFVAAVVLIAVGVGVYFLITALTAKDKGQPFTLSGTLSLRADSITTSGLPREFACAGKGGYNDIGPGTAVTVANESGTLLAKGTLDSSIGENTWCVFDFDIKDVPAGSKFYKVQISHRGEMSYTEQEARGRVEISLGDSPSESTLAPSPSAPPPPAPAPAPVPAPAPRGPTPADPTVPAYSTQCSSGVAVGSSKTSCAFAEVVQNTYLAYSRGGGTVVIYPFSPVTGKTYEMTCTGQRVVTCTGGDNAVVYLY
jgi:hypothetical protein